MKHFPKKVFFYFRAYTEQVFSSMFDTEQEIRQISLSLVISAGFSLVLAFIVNFAYESSPELRMLDFASQILTQKQSGNSLAHVRYKPQGGTLSYLTSTAGGGGRFETRNFTPKVSSSFLLEDPKISERAINSLQNGTRFSENCLH